ncbi:MBL fold metallo-hydrolase [Photorhabdus laumondii subsp. laumondii]|uniref:Photorhabdus luminescens subsp. laumondii TTO1 complete genome segment 15/17 n=2 Tax=Photorhabdus laumondii subsp. laumondii TaxID=141679 RepID=Q7MZE5_PHOLL|nr:MULTISPECIES: MBL fold metallo-hydrolase [Photorhabdus]AWK43900.1 hypothetical protein A4R40_21540 [Photorhabdus laumondii subsp. laumondii]AXG44573.1 hypothetical protein PluDJC_21500 [Photorhabdus laumondii subsp. laumondii]AXG49208.1 hypothetical protein PluTT01m_22205 [Photorhabdus laumondii subsp. laumondii]KTL59937.1 hypothetical protein AA106_15140 [Photorhabdus laumondii subsp. laumondii]MCC8386043.1 MBL fold metallo-hydrolase [Photorhabdus laumondii]
MLRLKVLKAKNGDCILLSWENNGVTRNILIDGGKSSVYKTGPLKGELYKTLKLIEERNERVDKLILTHVDDDHIGGILNGFRSGELLISLCDKVWFNSGKLIKEAFDSDVLPENELELERINVQDGKTSIQQGVSFEKRISELGIWENWLIESGYTCEFFGAKITVLSPKREDLARLLCKWEKEVPQSITSGKKTDYGKSLEELNLNDKFLSDKSIHNGSSIAILFEYNNHKILLLGDAHDGVVCDAISSLKDEQGQNISSSNKLKVDYIKLSHHGSEFNTSARFLNLIDCKNFIISTDGSSHELPNKKTIARIVKNVDNANIIFNYPTLLNRIFSVKEIEELKNIGITTDNCDELIHVK